MSCSSHQSCERKLVHNADKDAILVGKYVLRNQISTPCDTFVKFAEIFMEENNLKMPGTPMETSVLYRELLFHIDGYFLVQAKLYVFFFPYFKVRKKELSG